MTVESIVFDFGGVLIDWNPRYLYRQVFRDEEKMEYFLSHVCTPEWNAALDKGKPFQQGVKELLPLYPEYAEEIKMYDTRWEEMCGKEIEGSVRLLRAVARRYPVYGLTNWSAEKFKITLPKHDFFNLFKGIVVSGVEKECKPDPALFKILIERYGLIPGKTIFIDDSFPNIETAKQLGFQTIHFNSPEKLKKELSARGVVLD